jgi:hypothetical protein
LRTLRGFEIDLLQREGAVSDQQPSPKTEVAPDAETDKGRSPFTAKRASVWAGVGIRLFILILIGALVLVVAREWDWWVGSSTLQRTDDAYLQADTTPLAAKVPGYVSRAKRRRPPRHWRGKRLHAIWRRSI